jgi:hypothetical protein
MKDLGQVTRIEGSPQLLYLGMHFVALAEQFSAHSRLLVL